MTADTRPGPSAALRGSTAAVRQRGVVVMGRGDLDDQHWLDERIAAIGDGIEAVLDIARNWTELRNLSRLHPGVSAQDYILARVEHPLGRGVVVPLLAESNLSQAQIAAIAGVSTATVSRTVADVTVERPAETLGADGKLRPARVVREVVAEVIEPADSTSPVPLKVASPFWPQLLAVRDAIRDLSAVSPDVLAAHVPARRRHQFARDLRRHGLILGAVAARLEDME